MYKFFKLETNKIGICGMEVIGGYINWRKLKGLYLWNNRKDFIGFLSLMSLRVGEYDVDLVQIIENEQLDQQLNQIKNTINWNEKI